MKTITEKLPLLLVLFVATGLLYAGARMIPAGIASYQAEAFIGAWEQAAAEPSPRAWVIAQGAAQRAVDWYPAANGDHLDRLGRIYSWWQFRHPYGDPLAEVSRRAALETYRAATAARPAWPYSWERLAHTKLYLQQFDGEFAHALNEARRLGPWRIGVNRELAAIGLSAWAQLDEKQRQASLESARRVAAYGPAEAKRLLELAEATGHLDELCNKLGPALITTRKLTPCT
ncbi:hypothetical protein LPB260_14170 [Pseudomonas sp. LPB0260]|uniref:hypothetical protein n=1 Tax=Pseudomonas sp. LPB0260 TaxID=2614442 RepID=UPI0015C1DD8F|nr:hypothetical protein [Pseudomonas sp. LPB0260]QLC74724.1 hypothetical protein LPB260_14170 [Pseudomonas sp. LPB0260]